MGNCIRKGSAAEWGGEDWGSFGSGDKTRIGKKSGVGSSGKMQKSSLPVEGKVVTSGCISASATASDEVTEVKVKISKKQLETLLKKADVEGLSTEQVLAQLMNVADQLEAHQRSWKPALKSIPE
ncbi:hypothetical protein ABFS82_13G169000 [Erythranthe guttata]|uniref:Uncharacterized protein n=1 Tax=Erythranthe guttata TaxID=4155 RepID=A0A022PUP7_ERYGU|nr:PREDICTED: uncharacterized protein LOC105948723 [Erythranthe guttata]EYU19259.1 hypothetical protein MIMGU_mgv1a016350mg [Erythranthe guttata]|eukprot:XP_012827406.1 PREDICTED: uncharacterized protein LOC105948723 [Erythranthe guttata]